MLYYYIIYTPLDAGVREMRESSTPPFNRDVRAMHNLMDPTAQNPSICLAH